jgi:hypothetical protein
MDLYDALPASWVLLVRWIGEDPRRAQDVGTRVIQRILTVPGLVKEIEDIIAGADAAEPAAKKRRPKREKAIFDPIEVARDGRSRAAGQIDRADTFAID